MKNNSNTLGLHNMNGLSADDKRTCALNELPRRSAGADCVFAGYERGERAARHGLQHHKHELPQGLTSRLPACMRKRAGGACISARCSRKAMQKEAFP